MSKKPKKAPVSKQPKKQEEPKSNKIKVRLIALFLLFIFFISICQLGFSGGEKKRNEIFQMAMLNPTLAILDETDSGLDVDALRIVANGVNKLKTPDNASIVITHYQRLLDYIVPDIVHVLYKGRIIKTSGKELALEVEKRGYDWLIESL